MAAAVLAIDHSAALSPAEELAGLTAKELLEASRETSKTYNGIVLRQALLIVQARLRIFSQGVIAKKLLLAKSTVSRWSRGKPVSNALLERGLRDLVFLLMEAPVLTGAHKKEGA